MKHLAVLLIFFLICLTGRGQQYSTIDSLKSVLKEAQGNDRTNTLYELAWQYRKSQPDSTIYYSNMVLGELPVEELTREHAKAYNFIGLGYHYKGDDVTAFDFYNKALDAAHQSADSSQLAHSLNNMGRMFMNQGDLVRAYDNYNDAFTIFRKINDREGLGYAYKSLSELYQTQNQLDKALEMTEKTLVLRKEERNLHGQISILDEMAYIYCLMKNYPEALGKYEESLDISARLHDEVSTARTYLGISNLYFQEEKYVVSGEYAEKAHERAQSSSNNSLKNEINLQLGKTYYMRGEPDKAEIYLEGVVRLADKFKNLTVEKEAYQYLSLIRQQQGKYQEALQDHRRYSEIAQVLNSTEAARTIERLEARIEIEKKEKENDLLQVQRMADQAKIDRQQLQTILLLVAVIAFLIIMVILVVVYLRSREANIMLVRKNSFIDTQREEITNQSQRIVQQNEKLMVRNETLAALNNEKDTLMNILAHDLKAPFNRVHGIGHLLEYTQLNEEQSTYVKMLFSAAENGLNLIRDLLEVSAAEGETSRTLHISEIGLDEILREKAETFQSDAETKHIRLKVLITEELHVMTDQHYLSRILDNLISNAIKFSPPEKEVLLSAGVSKETFFVSVKDFGQGFTESDRKNIYHKFSRLSARPTGGESSNGLGLAIVKLLVDNMGGEIELISEPGKGSEFILRFPVRVKEEITS